MNVFTTVRFFKNAIEEVNNLLSSTLPILGDEEFVQELFSSAIAGNQFRVNLCMTRDRDGCPHVFSIGFFVGRTYVEITWKEGGEFAPSLWDINVALETAQQAAKDASGYHWQEVAEKKFQMVSPSGEMTKWVTVV